MARTFSACEVIELGIQIENNGKEFYAALAEKSDNPKAEEMFKFLSKAEDKHIAVFKDMFDASCEYKPEGAYPDEYFSFMSNLASNYVFTKEGKGTEIAAKASGYQAGIDLGIGFEKDSILFYEEMRKIVPADSTDIIDRIIAEEKKHLGYLYELKEVCSDEECKGI